MSVDLKTFDFNFFANDFDINPLLLKTITGNFDSRQEAMNCIKQLMVDYDYKDKEFTMADQLAIYLYLRFYESGYEDNIIMERLRSSEDPEELKLFTGKSQLSKKDKKKLETMTLEDLLKNGLP